MGLEELSGRQNHDEAQEAGRKTVIRPRIPAAVNHQSATGMEASGLQPTGNYAAAAAAAVAAVEASY